MSSINNFVQRIQTIDAQRAKIKKMLERGEHIGAGLMVAVNCGVPGDDVQWDLNLEVMHETEDLLKLLDKSLEKSRELQLIMLRGDVRVANEFLQAEGDRLTHDRPRG